MRGALAIGCVGLALRLAFILWAPGEVTGDARWYHTYASFLARGMGYVELDGSPAVQWMPGWPLLLAAVYSLGDALPRVGMTLNAVLGGATAGLLTLLGARLFDRRIGLVAGGLYAVWPGTIYFAATLMNEVAFSFFLVASLTLLAEGTAPGRRATRWSATAGLCFGAAALIRAEPWVLAPVVGLFLWTSLGALPAATRAGAAFALGAALVVAPWGVRNHVHFDRVLLTSASGGFNAWLGNHAGATGGEMAGHGIRYAEQHRRETRALTTLAIHDAGWRDAWAFVRAEPGEVARLAGRKLRLTYAGDDGGIRMVRGVRRQNGHLAPETYARLVGIANLFWWAALCLAGAGLSTLGHFALPARVLVLGLPAAWLAVHVAFLGGARFHVPEIPAIALLAGCGWDAIARRSSAARRVRHDGDRPEEQGR